MSNARQARKISSAGPELSWPIEMVPPGTLKPSPRNARTHSKKQIQQIAESMARFGAINPIIADSRGQIVAGHARVEAAKLLNLTRVPVIRVSHLSEPELRAYMLADNKLAEKSGWDRELLALEIQELQISLPAEDLDLTITGFEPAEIDAIIADLSETDGHDLCEAEEIDASAVAREDDVFILGKHRLLVGDARQAESYKRLMAGELAQMAFLDAPYNVPVQGHVGGRGKVHHREFPCASGEMTSEKFTDFLKQTLGLCSQHVIDGAISFVCMDWRHARELLDAGAAAYDELKNICVWKKTNAGQGSFYRNQHELVFVYKTGIAQHVNTFELGQHGRSRTNVWTYAGANSFRAGRMDDLKMHPTVKPVGLVADAMKDCSKRGSIVLDVFCGSGTTIVAAEQVGRKAYCMEIDPAYVDVAIRRWQKLTGKDALLERTGQTFDEVRLVRDDLAP